MKCVNNTAKLLASSILLTLVACGGSSSTETPPPPPPVQKDTTPDAFAFTAHTNAELETDVESNEITVSGIDAAATISINNGAYSINNGAYIASNSSVENGDTVRLKLKSSSEANQQVDATLNIGGVKATFSVTTKEAPKTPDNVQVSLNFDTRHSVGGVDSFDRQKFITIHADVTENGWNDNDVHSRNAPNEDPNLLDNFANDYDVYFGRNTGSISWNLSRVAEDGSKPGFASEDDLTTLGNGAKWGYLNYSGSRWDAVRKNQHRALDMIVGAQQHPFWPEGTLTNQGKWALSQTDTVDEPLGTATGHYMGQFINKFFDSNRNDSVTDGQIRPTLIEVMNEPLYDLTTIREGQANYVEPADIFAFHNTVADEIRKLNDDVLIGGYTVAFPNFDWDNFERWEQRDKLFIDIAGENMDFYSIHLYDFPAWNNREQYRKGSNMEATMDMLEQYSLIKFGDTRPLVISEYGAAIHSMFNQGWNPERNTLQMRAANSMLMQFMERPDMVLKTIPFFVVKAEWGRTDVPYGPRLMIQKFERDGAGAGDQWVYSDLVMFYQLWAEVKGTRIETHATDLDIQVDGYVDDATAYIILNSLEFEDTDIDLNAFGINSDSVTEVEIKHLTTLPGAEQASTLDVETTSDLPSTITLGAESTMVIKITFNESVTIDQQVEETKYYAGEYKKAITAGSEITLSINDIAVPAQGESVLRLGVGRAHNKSLSPTILVNGVSLEVPADFRGYDQKQGKVNPGRDGFYGVLEIPVPISALRENNQISVTFADDGGFIASSALQVLASSQPLSR
ncbi:agarase [Thalassotalea agarivorans]|uniref:Agarase n=1 Tax=Thalassotalea agarivorans TaxID=349064 RepID=A0A1I0DZC9_THASX|nr:agarase [Thalassotalea agarivorans]SET37963.1 agarase [Thalassotalea agarivorans]